MTPFNMTPFKMENGHFCTDETKGKPHLPDQPTGPKGSVFLGPVCDPCDDGDCGTWLEYVKDKRKPESLGDDPNQLFWFVIYDKGGKAPLNQSPVFTWAELGTMVSRLAGLITEKAFTDLKPDSKPPWVLGSR